MNIDDVLEMLDDLLDKAPGVPFSGRKAVVDADKVRDLLNEIRLNLPQEIKQAKMIVLDRQSILSEAKKEAASIVNRAEERAKALVEHDEITKAAKQRGTEILLQAQSKAKEIRNATNEYVDNILDQTDKCLSSNLADVRKTRQAIRSNSKNPSALN